jgi:hypothetical protein
MNLKMVEERKPALILTFSPGEKEQLRRVGILRRWHSRIRYGRIGRNAETMKVFS